MKTHQTLIECRKSSVRLSRPPDLLCTGFWNCSVHDKVPMVSVRPEEATMVRFETTRLVVASTAGVTTLLLICKVRVTPPRSIFGDCSGKSAMVERPGLGLVSEFSTKLEILDIVSQYQRHVFLPMRRQVFLFIITEHQFIYEYGPGGADERQPHDF